MDDLGFYVFLNTISVISGRWEGDGDGLVEMEHYLRFNRFPPTGIGLGTARSAGQRLTHSTESNN